MFPVISTAWGVHALNDAEMRFLRIDGPLIYSFFVYFVFVFVFSSFILQVSPTILKITQCSTDQKKTVTITPTIPIGEAIKIDPHAPPKYLNISLLLPKGIQTEQCTMEMRDLTPITFRVTAICSTIAGTPDKVIIPEIVDMHSQFWNPSTVHLPSIWVSPLLDIYMLCYRRIW